MKPADNMTMDIFLQPGETYFGARNTRIRTVLGSCVSVVFWHPALLLGGMCHYTMPGRSRGSPDKLDGRYADEAFELMLQEIRRRGTQAGEYQVQVFGGDMFPHAREESGSHAGLKNVEAARRLIARHNMATASEHLEGAGHRTIIFDVGSGRVWVKQLAPAYSDESGDLPPCAA